MAKNRGICMAHTCIPQYREYPPGVYEYKKYFNWEYDNLYMNIKNLFINMKTYFHENLFFIFMNKNIYMILSNVHQILSVEHDSVKVKVLVPQA